VVAFGPKAAGKETPRVSRASRSRFSFQTRNKAKASNASQRSPSKSAGRTAGFGESLALNDLVGSAFRGDNVKAALRRRAARVTRQSRLIDELFKANFFDDPFP
jgi:hypothetical protein